jgi:hypothetical protein
VQRLGLAVLLVASAARADSVVLPDGAVAVDVGLEINVAPAAYANPLSLAPDVWWGIAPRWTVGLIHSDTSVDRIEAGASLCLHGCSFYHGGGIDARYELVSGDVAVAPRARFVIRDDDPWKPALDLGALGRWRHGRWTITADPYLQLGLANRDRGNRSQLVVPVWFGTDVGRWGFALETGYATQLIVWRDGWHVPIGGVVTATVAPHVAVGVEVGFASLLGPQNTPKDRVVLVTLTLASMAPVRVSAGIGAAASPASRD